jgi:hypothetical protein
VGTAQAEELEGLAASGKQAEPAAAHLAGIERHMRERKLQAATLTERLARVGDQVLYNIQSRSTLALCMHRQPPLACPRVARTPGARCMVVRRPTFHVAVLNVHLLCPMCRQRRTRSAARGRPSSWRTSCFGMCGRLTPTGRSAGVPSLRLGCPRVSFWCRSAMQAGSTATL